MGWLGRTALPLLLAGISARRYASLRGPMLWLAVVRGVGLRAAIPVLVLLALARRLTRSRPPGQRHAPGVRAGAVARR